MARIVNIPREWLRERTSVEKVRRECEDPCFPASFVERYVCDVVEVSKRLDPGDELWKFCSPEDTWLAKCGTAGLAIVREGEIIYAEQVAMN